MGAFLPAAWHSAVCNAKRDFARIRRHQYCSHRVGISRDQIDRSGSQIANQQRVLEALGWLEVHQSDLEQTKGRL
jgi:hypothetical protein